MASMSVADQKHAELLDMPESANLPATTDRGGAIAMFERLATDPNASVEKIERLMALWERAEGRKAEQAFNAAMTAAQHEMTPVARDSDNPQTRSRYASYQALDRAIRPIYTRHGFGLSFDTGEAPQELTVRVVCLVTHVAGHSRLYHLDMPVDGKGAKGGDVMTRTHATGSGLSYGMRYLLRLIWNIAVGEGDDDGNAAGRQREPDEIKAPSGFEDWLIDLEATADNGTPALMAAWNRSPVALRNHLVQTNPKKWNDLKARAARVTDAAKGKQ